MSLLADSDRFRKTLGGLCLIAAPLALFAGALVHPGLDPSASGLLRLVAHHRDAWYLTHILGWAFVVLAIPAILALMHLLRERQAALANVGGSLALLGVIGFAGVVAIYGFVTWQMVTVGNQAQMAELFHRLSTSPGVFVPLKGLSVGLVPGFGLLALGLMRARAVPLWMPPLFALGFLVFGLGMISSQTEVIVIGTALISLGMGAIGLRILRRSIGEWCDSEHLQAASPAPMEI